MKIELSNFKQHSELAIELPSRGIVRLSGDSGAGKSTVLRAVEFALYGNARGIKPWSGGNPSVKLTDFFGLDIERTNTPNVLKVSKGGEEYLDDAAQAVIDASLGMDYNEFMISSYIKQKSQNSILMQEPSKIMKIISNLISKEVDIDKFKAVLLTRMQQQKVSESVSRSIYSENMIKLKEAKDRLATLPIPTEPVAPDSLSLSESIESDLSVAKIKLSDIRKNKIESELQKKRLLEIEVELGVASKGLENIGSTEIGTSWTELSKEEITQKQTLYIKKAEYLKKFNELIRLAGETHDRFPEAKQWKGKLSLFLEERLAESLEKLTTIGSSIKEINAELETINNWDKESLSCPSCGDSLKILDGKLVKASKKPDNFEVKTKELGLKKISLENESIEVQKVSKALKDTLYKASSLKDNLGADPLPEVTNANELDKKVQETNSYINEQSEIEKKSSKLLLMKSQFETTQKDLRDKLAVIKHSLLDKKTDDSEVAKLVEVLELKKIQLSKYKSELANYTNMKSIYDNFSGMVANMESNTATSLSEAYAEADKLAALELLKERTWFAAASALDHKIEEMNLSAEKHVERMFDGDGTVIRLTSTKTTQKGDERAAIGIDITHKGEKVKSFGDFSGGEESRVCLAYQLGLADLYKSPILMVDEGLTGLQDDKKGECIELLKEAAEDKLVIVIEHGFRDSFFDEVVNL